MANASRDQNFVTSILAVLDSDGKTVVPIRANPANNKLKALDNTTGSDQGPVNAVRDGNFVTSWIGVSNLDFTTPTVIYGDVNGNLLVDSI